MANKAGSLIYDFPGTELDPGLFAVEGSPLVVNHTAVLHEAEEFHTLHDYDFTETAVYFKADFPDENATGVFTIRAADDLYLQIIKEGDTLTFRRRFFTLVTDTSVTWDKDAQGWWKIQETGGVATFFTGADGNKWDVQREVQHTMDLTSTTVSFSTTPVTTIEGAGYGLDTYGIMPYGGA